MESLTLVEHIPKSVEWTYQHLKQAHYLNLWLGETSIIPQGYTIIITFPLNQIELTWNAIQFKENISLEFVSQSPYLNNPALLSFTVTKKGNSSIVTLVEKANYSESSWKRSREIHEDFWKKALHRLKDCATSESKNLRSSKHHLN